MSARGREFSHPIARSCPRFKCCRKAASGFGQCLAIAKALVPQSQRDPHTRLIGVLIARLYYHLPATFGLALEGQEFGPQKKNFLRGWRRLFRQFQELLHPSPIALLSWHAQGLLEHRLGQQDPMVRGCIGDAFELANSLFDPVERQQSGT